MGKKLVAYQSISVGNHDDNGNDSNNFQHTGGHNSPAAKRKLNMIFSFTVGALLFITADWFRIRLFGSTKSVRTSLKDDGVVTAGGKPNETNRLFHDAIINDAAPSTINNEPTTQARTPTTNNIINSTAFCIGILVVDIDGHRRRCRRTSRSHARRCCGGSPAPRVG